MQDKKYIISMIAALILGLILGYFIFNKNDIKKISQNTQDNNVIKTTKEQVEEIWTCSMHPQIRQNELGACPLCGMDLIPLEENSSDDPLVLQMTNEAIKLSNIQTVTIGFKDKGLEQESRSKRLSGKVKADERLAASQVAHIPGRVEKLFVSFIGEKVSKGQKVATIYSPDLVTAQRELLEAIKLQDINPSLIESARNKLRYWKINQKLIDKIEHTGMIQETVVLYADKSGVVTNKHISVGDYVKKGDPLFDLINLSNVWVLFDAYEEDLSNYKIGDKIEFTTSALPGKRFNTKVTFIDPVIDPITRVASLRTEIKNGKGFLKPEMFVYGKLQLQPSNEHEIMIPKTAVLWTGKRSVVYVKLPNMDIPSFKYREIELGQGIGSMYEVVDGLEVGEEIVTYGSFTIDAAAQLNNQVSMMNKHVKNKDQLLIEQLPNYTELTPVVFKEQLGELTEKYLKLKDAFTSSNSEATSKAADSVDKQLSKVDMSLLKGESHDYWMIQLKNIESHNNKIKALDEIEAQRKEFDFLSQAMIKAIKVFGINTDTLYIEHCPMVFNNQGADWISSEKIIRNPYFGDKMMKCGVIKDTITKNYRN